MDEKENTQPTENTPQLLDVPQEPSQPQFQTFVKQIVYGIGNLETYTEDPYNKSLRGRFSIQDITNAWTFLQDRPRVNRSRNVARLGHTRLWRRKNGSYHLTCTFKGDEPYLTSTLQAELRLLITQLVNGNIK